MIWKHRLWWALIILMLLGGLVLASCGVERRQDTVPLSHVLRLAETGDLKRVTIRDRLMIAEPRQGGVPLQTYLGARTDPYRRFAAAGIDIGQSRHVEVIYEPLSDSHQTSTLWLILIVVHACLLIALWPRRLARPSKENREFAQSQARLYVPAHGSTTFADVAGVDEAKEELQEVVSFLRNPERFRAVGARTPRGVLLIGPPGTGKTLLARALAGECRASFLAASGSEFVEVYVGIGAARVRDLFARARRIRPCIVFIDELDAIGKRRRTTSTSGTQEWEQTVNQLLVEMDGFKTDSDLVVLAATNRPDVIDPALLRPGRFDRKVLLDYPDAHARLAILRLHISGRPLEPGVDLESLSRAASGLAGAGLANLVNEAAILAVRRKKRVIGQMELEDALERVRCGPERSSRVPSSGEKAVRAYHEAGHALVAYHLGWLDNTCSLSVLPRGPGPDPRWLPPDAGRRLATRSELEERLAVVLAGRVAEELAFTWEGITNNAADDLAQASRLAHQMLRRYGMGRELGPVSLGSESRLDPVRSNLVIELVDREMHRLSQRASDRCREILEEHRTELEQIAHMLVAREKVRGGELARLLSTESAQPTTDVALVA